MILASCSGLIVSYDRTSGERVWEYDVKADGIAQSFHGEMARYEESLFVAPDPTDGHVYRIAALTGEIQWKWRSEAGVSSDLFVVGDRVVAVTEDNRLTLLDAATGELLWQTEAVEADRFAPVTPTPVFVDGALFFARSDGRVTRHGLTGPTPVWELWLSAGVSTDVVLLDGVMLLGTTGGQMHRVSLDGEILASVQLETMPTYRWMPTEDGLLVGLTMVTGPERQLIGLDPRSLEVEWTSLAPDGESWTTAQPALAWNEVLVGTTGPALYGVDPESGEIRWRAFTDHPPRTVAVDGDELFVGTFDGTLNVYWRR